MWPMDVRWDTMQPSAGKNYGAPESWKAQGNLTNPGLGETMWDVRRHAKGAVRSGIQLPYFLSQETGDVTRLARHTHRLSPGQPPNWRQQCIGFCGNRVLGCQTGQTTARLPHPNVASSSSAPPLPQLPIPSNVPRSRTPTPVPARLHGASHPTPFLFLNPIGLAPPARRQQRRIGVQRWKEREGWWTSEDQGKDKGKDKSKQSYWQRSP